MDTLTEEQRQLLDDLKSNNLNQLNDMKDEEILESIKAMARPMFEVFLQDMKIDVTKQNGIVNFKLSTNDLIKDIIEYSVDAFIKLMQSYQKLYGNNEETEVANITIL